MGLQLNGFSVPRSKAIVVRNLNLAGCIISVWALSKVTGRLSIGLFGLLSKIMQGLRHLLVRCISMGGESSKTKRWHSIGFDSQEQCHSIKPALRAFFMSAHNGCGEVFHKHEEKESDVNLAISLVSGACNDEYDIAIIITADSDLCPPIKYVKERFPDKELWLVAPPGRIKRAADLCLLSSRSMEINNNALRASCMRDEFYKGGVLVARRPQEWRAVANTGQRRARSR